MKILALVFHLWILVGLLAFFFFSFTTSFQNFDDPDDLSKTYIYNRFAEVKKECGFVLSLPSELKPDDNRGYRLKGELSFDHGDWEQEAGGAPLMPFDDSDMPKNDPSLTSPLKLVSFMVKDVDSIRRSENMVSVSGLLSIGITRYNLFSNDLHQEFYMRPGLSRLTVAFEGVYIESKENGGERLMCLLGTTSALPAAKGFIDAGELVNGYGYNYNYKPPLLQDDQILLVLRYPQTFTLTTLTSRVIQGEMKSLNGKSNSKYFDKVHITSLMGRYSKYQFGSEGLVSKACTPYRYQDDLMDDGIEISNGFEFCETLQHLEYSAVFNIVPNWKCNGTDEYCSKLGPFVLGKEIKAKDGSFDNIRLIMQDVKCEQETDQNRISNARVSAVFQAIPSTTYQYMAERTGLSGMTLSAEGIWNSSCGQLCMIGCLGLIDSGSYGCDSWICLYFPRHFSIKQRSVIYGTIYSIKNKTDSYFPLLFETVLHPEDFREKYYWYIRSYLSYKYSKINLASAFLERSQSLNFGNFVRKLLFSYPALDDGEEMDTLDHLSSELSLRVYAVPNPLSTAHPPRTHIRMELLSLGPLFRHDHSLFYESHLKKKTVSAKAERTKHQLLNVSAHLKFTEETYNNLSVLFLEGLYDPIVGKMYLIGCRDVHASLKLILESMDLEESGLDCLIEVKIEYPPKTAKWVINPTAKISITSQRNYDDPLHFSTISLQTLVISSWFQGLQDTILRKTCKGILQILMLSVAITSIASQLSYIKHKVDVIPYISLAMLGVQALGYSLALIYRIQSCDHEKNLWLDILDCTTKLLLLVALILTLRLCQKVWESRIRLLALTPIKPGQVPSDKMVLFVTWVIHVVGFLIAHIFRLRKWATELEKYVDLVQDSFLFPQIIGNTLWQIHSKPLSKVYYIGLTLVRLLLHVYNYMEDTIWNVSSEELASLMDFFSKPGNIAIPMTATALTLIVYIQQRWNYQKLRQTIKSWKKFLLFELKRDCFPSHLKAG